MRKVTDLSTIDTSVLKLELFPDESSTYSGKDDLEFDWSVTQFSSYFMNLQINWKQPVQISSGLQRDKLKMTILNNEMFFSAQTMTGIAKGTSGVIKVPKMMPNDKATEVFT